jgi:hypothetical protein
MTRGLWTKFFGETTFPIPSGFNTSEKFRWTKVLLLLWGLAFIDMIFGVYRSSTRLTYRLICTLMLSFYLDLAVTRLYLLCGLELRYELPLTVRLLGFQKNRFLLRDTFPLSFLCLVKKFSTERSVISLRLSEKDSEFIRFWLKAIPLWCLFIRRTELAAGDPLRI